MTAEAGTQSDRVTLVLMVCPRYVIGPSGGSVGIGPGPLKYCDTDVALIDGGPIKL